MIIYFLMDYSLMSSLQDNLQHQNFDLHSFKNLKTSWLCDTYIWRVVIFNLEI